MKEFDLKVYDLDLKIYDLEEAFGLTLENIDLDRPKLSLDDLEASLNKEDKPLVWLIENKAPEAKSAYAVNQASALTQSAERVEFLDSSQDESPQIPTFISNYIRAQGIRVVNTGHDGWQKRLSPEPVKKWRVNVLGLGDVGGTLLTGLRLMGHGTISEIGIFDLDAKRRRRWALELGQILDPNVKDYPAIREIEMDDLFDCDMFVFCASRSVPQVGSNVSDVRMIQYESNSKIIVPYAKMARDKGFEGIFAVVSDPVDQLCYKVFQSSNLNDAGVFDGQGLKADQVRGYGLGVMFARATYYAGVHNIAFEKGRAYGPHGKDLVVVNDPLHYEEEISQKLTDLTVKANLEVRESGYKPFIAPALSSGALSLINTMKGQWQDSAVMMGGIYIGCRNRLTEKGLEVERQAMNGGVLTRLNHVVKVLKAYV